MQACNRATNASVETRTQLTRNLDKRNLSVTNLVVGTLNRTVEDLFIQEYMTLVSMNRGRSCFHAADFLHRVECLFYLLQN